MSTPIFGDPTMRFETFARVLAEAGSPVLEEQPAGSYWTACIQYQVDPAFMLAVAHHEHQYGTAEGSIVKTYRTKSWGNTRSLSLPLPGCQVIDTTRGPFVRYAAWLQSLDDCCHRLLDPTRKYHQSGATTVEAVIPIWAPPSDNNDPSRYIAAVKADMARWAEERDVASPYADRMNLLPPLLRPDGSLDPRSNRTMRPLSGFHSVTIHETDNERPTANAQYHRIWLENSRPPASFTGCCDATESLQILPLEEVGWHIGDGADEPMHDEAYFTNGIEICVNSRTGFPAACRRAAKLAAHILKAKGVKKVVGGETAGCNVRPHRSYWSPENDQVHRGCPKHLIAGDWGVNLTDFYAMVRQEFAAITPQPVDDSHERLMVFYHALPPVFWGLQDYAHLFECALDFSVIPGAAEPGAHGLWTEYATYWTNPGDQAIHVVQPEYRAALLAAPGFQKY